MIFPLAPYHFVLLGALQLSLLCLFVEPWTALIPLVLLPIIHFLAALLPGFSYYLPIVSRGRRGETGVALTFDDGPDPLVTPALLKLLERHGARATFFVTGEKARRHPELVRSILAGGHSLGNHSFHHFPTLMLKGRKTLKREVESTQEVLRQFGVVPLAFRPPVGVTNAFLWRVLLEAGMFCVNFSCRAGDMGNRRIKHLASTVLGKAVPRDIILLHDVAPTNGSIEDLLAEFEAILQGLKQRGLEIRPLARLIGREIMQTSSVAGINPAELFYDGLAATYDQEQFCTNVSIARRTELGLFEARIPGIFEGAGRVLEIGAGTGIFTTKIARHCREVEALDISANMLALLEGKCRAEGITNVHPRVGNVETMELTGPYDVVCAFSSLEYLTDLPALLLRLAPHVPPGGMIYFITARRSLFRLFTQIGNAMRQGMWLRARSRRQFEAMLTAAGFEPVSITAYLLKCIISGGMLLEVVARRRDCALPPKPAGSADKTQDGKIR
jgi:peptidoglycan-N-acetylglucosamine deacetylase